VNAFAVGLPAVFWHQQGFLDLVAGTDYPAIATSAPLRIPDIQVSLSGCELWEQGHLSARFRRFNSLPIE